MNTALDNILDPAARCADATTARAFATIDDFAPAGAHFDG